VCVKLGKACGKLGYAFSKNKVCLRYAQGVLLKVCPDNSGKK
jgi:hypothetical protein